MNGSLLPLLLTLASLAGVRTSLALLAAALASLKGWGQLPPGLAFLATPAGIAALVGLAIAEECTEHSEDLQEILDIVNYGLRGSGGALVGWAIGAAGLQHGIPAPVVAALGGLLAATTHHLRMKLHRQLWGLGAGLLSPRTWLLWLEGGGTVGILAVLLVFPFLGLALMFMATLGGLALALLRRLVDRRVNRRPCPHCAAHPRKEARRCPACGGDVPIRRGLSR